jgi:hypothetical protein
MDHIIMPGRSALLGVLPFCVGVAFAPPGRAAEISYPQIVDTRYEAVDARAGGNFIIWQEREKVWHGPDPRLYPSVRYVDVTHLTPAPGSPPITVIEVTNVNASVPEYYHVAGIVRFKVTGMTIKSTSIPTH